MATTYSAWTSDEIDTEIAAVKTALAAARLGKSYQFNGRGVVRQDLDGLTKYMGYLVAEKNKLSRSGIRPRRMVTKP